MAVAAATRTSGIPIQTSHTVTRWMHITMTACRLALERTAAAEFPGPVMNSTDTDRRILLRQTVWTLTMRRNKAADTVLEVNNTLTAMKFPSNV